MKLNYKNGMVIRIALLVLITLALCPEAKPDKFTKPNEPGPWPGLEVNTCTGNLYLQRTDLVIPCRGIPLNITFSYNSLRAIQNWGYGNGWTHTFNIRLIKNNDYITVEWGDGQRDNFYWDGSGYNPPPGVYDRFSEFEPGKWRLTSKYGINHIFEDSTHMKLTAVVDRNGNRTELVYAGGHLMSVTDASGRQVTMTWIGNLLSEIKDENTTPARTINYQYDGSGNLTEVTNPTGVVTVYDYNDLGDLEQITDPRQNIVMIMYNELRGVSEVSCPEVGWKKTFDYNTWEYRTRVRNMLASGNLTTLYYYDDNDRITDIIYPDGNSIHYLWDGWNITGFINENGFTTNYEYDDAGNLTNQTDCMGNSEQFQYDEIFNQLLSHTNKSGNSTAYAYDENGNLTQITDCAGNLEIFAYDEFGNRISYTNKNGCTATYEYDNSGNLISETNPLANTSSYVYDQVGNLLNKTDKNGCTTTFEYDLLDQLISTTDAIGNSTLFVYDENGNRITETNPLGCVTQFEFDALNNLRIIIDASGGETLYSYDEEGKLLSETDALGYTTSYEYDSRGRVTATTDPMGNLEAYGYDAAGNKVIETDKNGNSTYYEYDCANRLIATTDPLGNSEFYTVNPLGLKEVFIDKNGNVTSYEYNCRGQLAITIDPLGYEEISDYDAEGNQVGFTDKNVNTTLYEFDCMNQVVVKIDAFAQEEHYGYTAMGDLFLIIDNNGKTTTFEFDCMRRKVWTKDAIDSTEYYNYNAVGDMISTTNKLGHTTTFEFDCLSRVTGLTDPIGFSEIYDYDAVGNRTGVTDKNENTVTFEFDGLSQHIRTIDPTGNDEIFVYDATGNMTGQTNKNGHTTTFEFDELGQVIKTIDPLGEEEITNYDAIGNQTGFTDKNGNTTTFEFDDLGRNIKITDPLGNETSYTYDEVGNQLSVADGNGNITLFDYDVLNRMKKMISPLGNQTQFDYDGVGNILKKIDANGQSTFYAYNDIYHLNAIFYPDGSNVIIQNDALGDVIQMNNTGGIGDVTFFQYDELGRIISKETNYGMFIKTIQNEYDPVGNRLSMTIPDEGTISYGYDPCNKITHVIDQVGGQTIYNHDTEGNITTMTYPNLTQSFTSYDQLNRILTQETKTPGGDVIQSFAYEYDANGNKTKETHEDATWVDNVYDDAGRMTSEYNSATAETVNYTYDAGSNRLTKTTNGVTENYTYDNDNKVLSAGLFSYTYDNNGNRLTKLDDFSGEFTTYTYGPENRMKTVNLPNIGMVNYYFSPLGENLAMNENGLYKYKLFCGNNPVQEMDQDGMAQTLYNPEISINHGHIDGYYHENGFGSTTLLTDVGTAPLATASFDGFGNIINSWGWWLNDHVIFQGMAFENLLNMYPLNSSSSNIKGNYDPQLGKLVHPQISMNTNFLEVNASSLSDQNSELLFSRSPFYHVNKKYTKHSKKNRIIIVYSDKYNPMAPGWPLPIMFLNEDDLKHIVLDNKTLKLNGFVKEGGFWEWLQKLTYNAYQQYSEEILKATISQSFKEAYENNEPVSRKVDTKHFGKQVNLNTGLRSQLNNRSLMGYASLGCLSCPTMGSSASISAAAVSPGVLVSSGYSWPNFGQKIKMASKQFTGLCNTVKLLQPRAKPKPPPPPCKVDVKAVSGAFMEGKTWGFGLRGAHTIHARAGQIIDLQATGNPSGGTFFYQFTQPKRGSAVQHGHKGKASFLSYRDGKYTATVYYVLPGNRMCKKEFVILVR